jgi:phosphotransferase system  glucose/maltose/N-acetylglucosamine-specific IIC component
MIIWSGFGILVAPIIIACLMAAGALTGQFSSDPDYFDLHGWPMGMGVVLSGVVCWFLGRHFQASGSQTLIDPKTGNPVVLHRRHSFFFIPMHWWAVLLIPFGLYASTINKTPEEVKQDRIEQAMKKEQRAAAREARRAR